MPEKIAMVKKDGKLVPSDWFAAEQLAKLPNKELIISVATPRNPKHHRLAFALLNKVVEAGGWDGSVDDLRDHLSYAIGSIEFRTDHRGRQHMTPKSWKFESMDQQHFGRMYDRMIWWICQHLLPGVEEGQLKKEIEEMIDG